MKSTFHKAHKQVHLIFDSLMMNIIHILLDLLNIYLLYDLHLYLVEYLHLYQA